MEALFVIDQNRSSGNWPLAKILQRYVTRRLGLRSASGRAKRQSGMGISPKTETRCHNFSFFENLVFENLDGRKNEKLWQLVSVFSEMPIPDWRSARPKAP